jgi:hypothetical protein
MAVKRKNRNFTFAVDSDLDAIQSKAKSLGVELTEKEVSGIELLKELAEKAKIVFGQDLLNYEFFFSELFKEAIAYAKNGEHVVLDIAPIADRELFLHDSLKKEIEQESYLGPFKLVLVLCPFKQLAQRLKLRNEKARLMNESHEYREGEFPLYQYAQLFHASAVSNEKPVIETLTYQDLVNAVDAILFEANNNNKEKITKRLARKLGIQESEEVFEFRAKLEYDFLCVNADFQALSECVSVIALLAVL